MNDDNNYYKYNEHDSVLKQKKETLQGRVLSFTSTMNRQVCNRLKSSSLI